MRKLQLVLALLLTSMVGYTQQDSQSKVKNEVYKDTLGNVISSDVFKEKVKSGIYSYNMQVDEGNVSYVLVNKKKSEKQFSEQLQNFRNKLLTTPLPSFKLMKLDGTEVNATSLNGKTLVFNFWFIGCKPCVAEMPLLNEVVDHYKGKSDILFLAPALDDQEKLIQFAGKHPFFYQVLSSSKELANGMNISSFPTHIIVSPKGVIKEVMVGGRDDINKSLIEAIDKIYNQ